MDLVIYFLEEGALWAVILAIFFLYFLFTHSTVGADNVETRRAIYMLREERWRKTYADLIASWLDWLDKLWTKEFQADPPPFTKHSLRAAFSHGLLNFTLAFALAYPVFGVLLHWLATGEAQSIGGVEVISSSDAWWRQPATIGGLALFGFAMWSAQAAIRIGAEVRHFVWLAFAFGVGYSLEAAVAVVFSGAFAVAVAIPVGLAVGGAIALAGPLAVAVASGSTFAVAGAFAGVVLGAVAFVCALAVAWLMARLRKPALLLFLWALLGVAAIIAAIIWPPAITLRMAGVIVFIGLLPLLNGITDFLSIGMTRLLLRRAEMTEARWTRPALWLFDLLFALFTLALLTAAFIAIIVLVRPASGEPLIDILALIADVRARPENYWWLGLMVFTTLLPSLMHMVAAAYSVAIFYLPKWREGLAARLEDGMRGDGQRGAEGRLRLVALLTLAWGAPTAALVTAASLVWSERVGLRTWSLDQAEAFALWVAGFA